MPTGTTSKVSKLDLINLLVAVTGCNVTTAVNWTNKHYASVLDLYPLLHEEWGPSPKKSGTGAYKALTKEADPELEALLAEEEAIEAEYSNSGYGPHKTATKKSTWDYVKSNVVLDMGVGMEDQKPLVNWDNVMYTYHSNHIPSGNFHLNDGAKNKIIKANQDLLTTPKKKKGKGI